MRVVLSAAISPNGLIARENGEEDWLPSEGWDEFVADARRAHNFIMGRETYDLVQALYPSHNFDDVQVPLKIIVTRNRRFAAPAAYTVAHSPAHALELVRAGGHPSALVIGGGQLSAAFLAQGVVDQLQLTVNPHLIGAGRPVIAPTRFETRLQLVGCEQLSLGRVKLTYRVL